MEKQNIFKITQLPSPEGEEFFEQLLNSGNMQIERIISTGQITLAGKWYDQEKNEWVILIQGNAKIEFENSEIIELEAGDYLYIPAHRKHRVTYTSSTPPCIWLAFFFD